MQIAQVHWYSVYSEGMERVTLTSNITKVEGRMDPPCYMNLVRNDQFKFVQNGFMIDKGWINFLQKSPTFNLNLVLL